MVTKYASRLAVGIVLAGALGSAVPAARAADLRPGDGAIEVVGTSEGFTMDGEHAAGFVTFQASSSHPAGALYSLLQLRTETALDDVLENLRRGISDDRAESVAGGRSVQEQARLLGGAAVLPGQPVTFTSFLGPGTYHLVNYQDLREGGVRQAADRQRTLTITHRWDVVRAPQVAATCVMTLGRDEAAFRMPATLPAGSALRVVNAMSQLSEAVFMPVRPGTTRQQMQEFFNAADRGDFSVPPPFIGGPVGLPALGPGRTTVLRVALRPGDYTLVTWYPNFDDGTMLAAQGQFAMVRIV